MPKWSHIDTKGMPEKYDCADVIESGITGSDLASYINDRIVPGPQPAVIEPVEDAPKKRQKAKKKKASVTPIPREESNVATLRKPDDDVDHDHPLEFSEDALADQFTEAYHETMLYCTAWQKWMIWDGSGWIKDDSMLAIDYVRKVIRKVVKDVSQREDLGSKRVRIANQISTYRTMKSVLGLAMSDRRHVVRPANFDADPWSINTPGGIVELKTGQIRPARKSDYVTKMVKVAPNNKKPKVWLEYLKAATEGDDELMAYMKRVAGYCLTGSIAEHAFFFLYGDGGTGKGTFKDFMDWMLQDYASVANIDTFTESRFKSHSSEIAMFAGARLVTATETDEGSRWAEARIKAMTGGDPITASFKHKNEFTYQPLFKLLFTGNHKPQLRAVDEAIRRRLYLIPFEHKVTPEEKDIYLPEKIREEEEAGAILNWMIEGCLEWQDTMLQPPKRVLAHTADYLESEDRIGRFLEDYTVPDPVGMMKSALLFMRYKEWSTSNNEFTLSRHRFHKLLQQKGYKTEKRGGEMVIMGLRNINA